MLIELGQKFRPRANNGVTITVLDDVPDDRGRIWVRSFNSALNTTKRQHIKARRLISSAYKLIPLLLIALVGACASPPIKPAGKTVGCQSSPQWYLSDENGNLNREVYICFSDDGKLLYEIRLFTAEQKKAFDAEQRKAFDEKAKAAAAIAVPAKDLTTAK